MKNIVNFLFTSAIKNVIIIYMNQKDITDISYFIPIIIKIIIVLIIVILLYMFCKGAINANKFKKCDSCKFNGIKQFKIHIPNHILDQCLKLANSIESKRVNLLGWKAGKTVPTTKMTLDIINFYKSLCSMISGIIGEKVQITELDLPTSCAVLTYDKPNDFINWHYDVNYFNGRFFTFIVMLDKSNKCTTKFVYKNENNVTKEIDLLPSECVLFEGDIIHHAATKMQDNEYRHILSMQFSTDPDITFVNGMLMRLKDQAYV